MLEVNSQIIIPVKELNFTFSRSSGPGGQNVNKVNSKVTLHWSVANSPSVPDEVRERFSQLFARRMNSQGRNVADCMEKLRAMLIEAAALPRKRKKTRPTRGSQERRLREKRAASQKKQLRSAPRHE